MGKWGEEMKLFGAGFMEQRGGGCVSVQLVSDSVFRAVRHAVVASYAPLLVDIAAHHLYRLRAATVFA